MGRQFQELSAAHVSFIESQRIFFVATAPDFGRINVSPKGMDSLVVLDSRRVAWLNTTGSGNETAAHVRGNPRMTVMFCAFEGKPLILRLYGKAKAYHPSDPEWPALIVAFKDLPGARQIFELDIDIVQTSCGMSIPFFDYLGEREELNNWARAKGEDGIRDYWATRNQVSIDGLPTGIDSQLLSSVPSGSKENPNNE